MCGSEGAGSRTDFVDAQRLRRLYDALHHVHRTVATATDRNALFTDICRTAVERAGFQSAWIGWYDAASDLIVPVAACGDDPSPGENLRIGIHAPPPGADAVATAFRSGRSAVCNDHRGRDRGVGSAMAVPIRLGTAVGGVLAVYGATVDEIQDDEIALIEATAADVSLALDRLAQADDRQRDAEYADRFAAIVESSNDAIISKSPCGVITSWNPAAERIFGYRAEEIIGRNISTVIPPDRLHEESNILGRIAHGERIVDFETLRLHKSGAAFPVSVTISPIQAADGRIVGASKIVRDITDRKRTERALQNAEARFRTVIEHLGEGLIITDFAGGLLEFNRAARRILGVADDEPFARTPREFFDRFEMTTLAGALVPAPERPLMRVVRGEDLRDVEYRVRRRDRVWERILSYSGSVLHYTEERSLAFVAFRDITERHHSAEALRGANASLEQRVEERTVELAIAKDRAESADRLKSAFLATMSHELRTPLNSIIGFTGIVLQGMAGPVSEEQGKQLGMVRSSARHLLTLINDVLDITRIEADAMPMLREECDLDASIDRIVASIEPSARVKGLELRVERIAPLGRAVTDRRRIEQVLINLLNNAVKFTDHGEVRLCAEVHAEPALLVFRVVDTGIGIADGDLGILFQPFSQVDSSLTRQHEGTGLGLAICRRLAELLGGTVTVQSRLGSGTEFTFSLPLLRPTAGASVTEPSVTEPSVTEP